MKTKLNTISLIAFAALAACATQPIAQRVSGLSPAEKNSYLFKACEDESWRGHDSVSHPHHNEDAHAAKVVKICRELAVQPANKASLVAECKTEAGKGDFTSEYRFNERVKALTEICEAF